MATIDVISVRLRTSEPAYYCSSRLMSLLVSENSTSLAENIPIKLHYVCGTIQMNHFSRSAMFFFVTADNSGTCFSSYYIKPVITALSK